MKIIILSLNALILCTTSALSQTTVVGWSSFTMGSGNAASVTTSAQAVVGELAVGSAHSATTGIESGFLAGASDSSSVTGTFTVTTVSDTGAGSLRSAIDLANASAGLDLITFNIPGSGVHTISVASPLPILRDPVIIDGYSQPGSSPNTNGPALGSNARLLVELSGPGGLSGTSGLVLRGGGSKVRGLLINGFAAAVTLDSLGINSVEGNFIGIDSSGTTAHPNLWGVSVQSANNVIGGNAPAARNVISGNYSDGISVAGVNSSNNYILGNYIGTSASGNEDLHNGGSGISLDAPSNYIGGPVAGGRNIILGGNNAAVFLPAGNTGGNTIEGNYIGTTAAGTGGLGSGGVYILTPGNILSGNIISGNRGISLQEADAAANIIRGNFIGLSAGGTTALSNNGGGIKLLRVSHTLIGGSTPQDRNTIAVRDNAISITEGDSNTVQGNYIGTDTTGTVGVISGGGPGSGIFVASSENLIGGTANGAGNVIANNGNGITITGGAWGNIIQGNLIGTNASGTGAIGNTARGISIVTPSASTLTRDNLIGGLVGGSGNVISGNTGPGIYIDGANNNTFQGNLIGLAVDAVSPLPNASDGIQIGTGDSNLIGGLLPGSGNRIAFNGAGFPNSKASGIKIFAGIGNAIECNSIYSNVRPGIDLVGGTEDVGITANDSCDADSGANNLQNYPLLTSANIGSGQITIQGDLNGTSNKTFMIQFFSSPTPDTMGYGGATAYLGTTYVITDDTCHAKFSVTLADSNLRGNYICATATDMANNTSEFSRSLRGGATSVYSVASGWNLLSIGNTPFDFRASAIFPTASSKAFTYKGGYIICDTLNPGTGYWLEFSDSQSVVVPGAPLSSDSLPVSSGWNMIGSIGTSVSIDSLTEIPPGIVISSYFSYNGAYQVASTIDPGLGYWVKCSVPGKLVLKSSSSMAFPAAANKESKGQNGFNALTFTPKSTGTARESQTIYFAKLLPAGERADHYELPPPAPGGMDVRFTTNRYAEFFSGGDNAPKEIPLSIHSAGAPVTLSWSMKEKTSLEYLLVEKQGEKVIAQHKLTTEGTITLSDVDKKTFTLKLSELPAVYALAQNYPNPFNPSTVIRFSLPATGRMTLKIYNIIGQEVATLIDGEREAGYQSAEWNAGNYSSGVYFYRMTAGKFNEVKKMMLVK